jgi:hypothetical protein
LKKSVLCGCEALSEEEIRLVVGGDVRDAPFVTVDYGFVDDAREFLIRFNVG